MAKEDCNVLEKFTPEEYRTIRRRMIECVLGTDMAFHSKHFATLKSKVDIFEIKQGKNVDKLVSDDVSKTYENQQIILSTFLHGADISNPSKPKLVYDQWVKLLFEEFFNQGDLEKQQNLPVSLLCDRSTTNINKAQVGFINFIVMPFWEIIYNITPEALPYLNNIKTNLKLYEEAIKNCV